MTRATSPARSLAAVEVSAGPKRVRKKFSNAICQAGGLSSGSGFFSSADFFSA
jgi:hypothetical protein